jgi:putative protein-disulfide isomerase
MPDGQKKQILELIQYTDPYCTWCWGSEPIMRHIEELYGGQVRFGFVMGGLVPDVSHFYDSLNRIGGEQMAEQVAAHWREASDKHGMPVDADVWLDMKGEFKSTWPANIAVKAAQMQDDDLAARFLRRLREAAATERRMIHRREVQLELADEAGLDLERFGLDLDSGKAEKAFLEDLEQCRERHVTGFPSFLINNDKGDEAMFFGFQPFNRFKALFGRLAGDDLVAREIVVDDENVLAFVRKYGRVAAQEVAEVFSLNLHQAEDILGVLVERGLMTKHKAGNGYLYFFGGNSDDPGE